MAPNKIKIIQHNIQSIRPTDTREELYTFLMKNEIKIALLQEIWLKEGETFRIKNVEMVSKRRGVWRSRDFDGEYSRVQRNYTARF